MYEDFLFTGKELLEFKYKYPELTLSEFIELKNLNFRCSLGEDTIRDIVVRIVCAHYQVSRKAVWSKSRKGDLPMARHTITYFLASLTKMSNKKIEDFLGRKHPSSNNSLKVMNNLLDTDKVFSKKISSLELKIHKKLRMPYENKETV